LPTAGIDKLRSSSRRNLALGYEIAIEIEIEIEIAIAIAIEIGDERPTWRDSGVSSSGFA
jgi:hypothetical protein